MNPYFQQNNNLITVRNEAEAMNYPVAFGNCVTFLNETAPYVYTKTMGTSPFEQPVFAKYRLVREDASDKPQEADMKVKGEEVAYASQIAFEALMEDVRALKEEIERIKATKKANSRKKEAIDDDSE